MPNYDVDYAHVRQNADIVAVLHHHNVTLSGDGIQRKGQCPFHKDTRQSLSVNVEENLFKCHSCGSGGNIIKLVQLLNSELKNPRKAALHIAELSGIAPRPNSGEAELLVGNEKFAGVAIGGGSDASNADADCSYTAHTEDGAAVNRPLTFILKLAPVQSEAAGPIGQFLSEHGITSAQRERPVFPGAQLR
ncbi:MAG: CHC2 zinc finger domain-containing protein [Hyphomicrobiales bacterium]|nr:CHC2 zinc finger domain-containing protein [Hyphomicrobiales bacterium]